MHVVSQVITQCVGEATTCKLQLLLFKLCSVIGLNNLLAAYEDKSAEAVCTFAYGSGNARDPILLFKGITPVRYSTT